MSTWNIQSAQTVHCKKLKWEEPLLIWGEFLNYCASCIQVQLVHYQSSIRFLNLIVRTESWGIWCLSPAGFGQKAWSSLHHWPKEKSDLFFSFLPLLHLKTGDHLRLLTQSPHVWNEGVLSPAPTLFRCIYLPTYTQNKSRSAHNAAARLLGFIVMQILW